MNSFDALVDFIKSHLDDPDSLSTALIDLGVLFYKQNQETAQAELEEEKSVISLMDSHLSGGEDVKKMSSLEANSRAKVLTNNQYKLKRLESEAIAEYINIIKVRINVLSWERKT